MLFRSFLKENHFKVSEFERLYDSMEGVLEGIREAEREREHLDFLIDGMVDVYKRQTCRYSAG